MEKLMQLNGINPIIVEKCQVYGAKNSKDMRQPGDLAEFFVMNESFDRLN